MTRATHPEAVETYLANTVGGEAYRALARRDGRPPSTHMRWCQAIEEARGDPGWDEALKLCEAQWRHGTQPDEVTDDWLCRVVCGMQMAELEPVAVEVRSAMRGRDLVLAMATDAAHNATNAMCFRDNVIVVKLPRRQLLAMLVLGWVEPVGSNAGQRACRYRPTADCPSGTSRVTRLASAGSYKTFNCAGPRCVTQLWDMTQGRRRSTVGLERHDVDAALRLREAMGTNDAERIAQVRASVGEELYALLNDYLLLDLGLEALEGRYGWPARSAKLMLRVALRLVQQHDEARQQEAA